MTEAEWLNRDDPWAMIHYLIHKASDRKLRLFAVACCRRIWSVLRDERAHAVVEVAERFADGNANKLELRTTRVALKSAHAELHWNQRRRAAEHALRAADATGESQSWDAARVASQNSAWASVSDGPNNPQERTAHVSLIRDIFGNPFRAVVFDAEWRTSTAIAIAQGMYESRDFSAMPILADALQDAGCEHADILSHCRDENATHVRGCWVVDLVLGKETPLPPTLTQD